MITARQNPFASHRIDRLSYRFPEGDWQTLISKWTRSHRQGAIIGPYGAGKTTLLEQLGAHLEQQGRCSELIFVNADRAWLTFGQWRAVWAAVCARRVLLIDGADLLPFWQWSVLRLCGRASRGIVIAGHRPLGLPVLADCRTSLAILERLLDDICAKEPWPARQQAAPLFRRHRGNIRGVFREMYLLTAQLSERPVGEK